MRERQWRCSNRSKWAAAHHSRQQKGRRNPLKLLGVALRLPASQTEKRDWLEAETGENGVYWSMTTRKPPSYNLAPAKEITKKKGPGDYPSPSKWWSRGESNPRPQVRYSKFYMRILLIWF